MSPLVHNLNLLAPGPPAFLPSDPALLARLYAAAAVSAAGATGSSMTATATATATPTTTESPPLTTPSIQLCLAHYCDTHGPTPLMVTEGLPVDCSECPSDHELATLLSPLMGGGGGDRRPRTTGASVGSARSQSAVAITAESLRVLGLQSQSRSASVPEQDAIAGRAALLRAAAGRPRDFSYALDTPPDTPRRSQEPPASHRDSGFRRTYDDYVTRKASPCENCAMTLPERQEGGPLGGAVPPLRADVRGPTLRTRAPYAKVYGGGLGGGGGGDGGGSSQTTSASHSSAASDSDREDHSRRAAAGSTRTSSSSSSTATAHTHYLNYTSTHEPVKPDSFSVVRASCLRTLSFEILPRPPSTAGAAAAAAAGMFPPATTSPQSPTMPTAAQFVTTHSAGAAVSGGPIFFGDPLAGYTTAYIFRIPDVHARGHKRVYAFMAISTHPESTTIKTFGYISSVFHDLALWIQRLAEAEAETARLTSPVHPPWFGFSNNGYPSGTATSSAASSQELQTDRRYSSGGGGSFLGSGGGLSRRMAGGPAGFAPKARGLAELVGLPDFFIQLHRKFVPILFELSMRLNS